MLSGVPTIAGRIGGLPEVVSDGFTGTTVPVRQPEELARAILHTLDSYERSRELAKTAHTLVGEMFAVQRTANEVHAIYEHVLSLEKTLPYISTR